MKTYAIISNNKVTNVIIAESLEAASIAGHAVEVSPEQRVGIDFEYDSNSNKFKSPQLYPSWTWNENLEEWEAPTPRPNPLYIWNEEKLEWEKAVEV